MISERECFILSTIPRKHAYYTCTTKCVMRNKLVPHYAFGSIGTICMFAKNCGKNETTSKLLETNELGFIYLSRKSWYFKNKVRLSGAVNANLYNFKIVIFYFSNKRFLTFHVVHMVTSSKQYSRVNWPNSLSIILSHYRTQVPHFLFLLIITITIKVAKDQCVFWRVTVIKYL